MKHILSDEELNRMLEDGVAVGSHAGQEACNAIARIVDTLPTGREKTFATCVAFGYLVAKMELLKKSDPFVAEGMELLSRLGTEFAQKKYEEGKF